MPQFRFGLRMLCYFPYRLPIYSTNAQPSGRGLYRSPSPDPPVMKGWKYVVPEFTFKVPEAGPTSTISAYIVWIYLSSAL
jgi:hypothetical protein